MIKIFIGYDPREAVAYYVLNHSIIRQSSQPVAITPLYLANLGNLMTRERNALQSTDFSFSRFLTPYLSNYEGWSIFMDCDMLIMDDIAKLWELRDERYAVQVVKHDHQPRETIKFLDAPQTPYQKKNWSSVIIFNNAKCRALTPEYVNTASGLELHQFKWLDNDEQIGEIHPRWNHLVGYESETNDVANAHYTLGGPYFNESVDCEFSKEWFAEREKMLHADQR